MRPRQRTSSPRSAADRAARASAHAPVATAEISAAQRDPPRRRRPTNARIREAFAASIPRLPYIGGRSNPLTENLHGAARFIAMWWALRDEGSSPEYVGGLFSDLYTATLSAHSPRVMHLLGRFHASRISRWMQRHQADRSPHHAHPGGRPEVDADGD